MKKNIQYGLVLSRVEGFTLIELLIVIALLGALAVGLLASLDPFEQFKKGSDTGTRNTVAELQASVIRYYSVKNAMPWGVAAVGTVAANEVTVGKPILDDIISTGELKTDFQTIAGNQLSYIFITAAANTLDFKVCFKPTSRSFLGDANAKYTNAGVIDTDAKITGAAKAKYDYCLATPLTCFWCM